MRRKFEAPVCFSDRALADIKKGHIICASYQNKRFSIKQIQCDRGIQAVASVQTGSTQTLRYACTFSTRNRIWPTGRQQCLFSAKTCQLAKMSVFMHSNYTSRSHILSIKWAFFSRWCSLAWCRLYGPVKMASLVCFTEHLWAIPSPSMHQGSLTPKRKKASCSCRVWGSSATRWPPGKTRSPEAHFQANLEN